MSSEEEKKNMSEQYGKRLGHGYIDQTSIDDFTFEEQYQNYQRSGYALDVTTQQVLGDYNGYLNAATTGSSQSGNQNNKVKKEQNKKRKIEEALLALQGYGSDEDEGSSNPLASGPWANLKADNSRLVPVSTALLPPPPASLAITASATSASSSSSTTIANPTVSTSEEPHIPDNVHIVEPELDDEHWEKHNERKLRFVLPPRAARGSAIDEATTVFHGDSLRDFQGRSWMAPPPGLHPDDELHECYIPKQCVKRLSGHTKGVQAIEFFPKTGHLLLSASLDGKCKIWDAQESYKVLRTYQGHSEAIRSMQMTADGHHFVSGGFDRVIRYWDVETGQATATFTNRKMPYCLRFNPRDNNIFLAASSDNRIYQWDIRTGSICQEYNYHLQACNSITFIDEGRKFISTSDDKKVLVWEYDIPVPIHYIAEPDMHCIPAMSHHPTEDFVVGQSMDNKIVTYSSGSRVKPVKKRVYTGHNNTGYACQIGFSPNGKFMMSGDGLGQLLFWDWKSTKIYRKFHAHEGGPCMGVQWHPLHANRVASCGWDGLIKIWE